MRRCLIILLLAVVLAGCGETERARIEADSAVKVAEHDRMAREAEAAARADTWWIVSRSLVVLGVVGAAFWLARDKMHLDHRLNVKLLDYDQERWCLAQKAQHDAQMAALVSQHLATLELDDLRPVGERQYYALASGAQWSVMDTDAATGARVGALVDKSGRVKAYLLTG